MVDYKRTVTVSAPATTAWRIMSDIEGWPDWNEATLQASWLDHGAMRVGARARIKQPRLPPVVWTVTDVVPGEYFQWVTVSPGIRTRGIHRASQISPTATEVTVGILQSGPLASLAALLVGSRARRYVDLEAEGLLRHCAQHPA